MGPEGVGLKDHADIALFRREMKSVSGDGPPADGDAAAIKAFQARGKPQQRGLAAARRSQNGKELAGSDLQGNRIQDLLVAEGFGDI